MLDPRGPSIEYQSAVKRDDLVLELCTTRKPTKSKLMDQAVLISDLLKAVSYKTTYLEDAVVNNLYQRLIEAAEVYDYPVAPALPTLALPDSGNTIIIQGTPGPPGQDGGATDFLSVGVATNTVVDTFAVDQAYGARWDYLVNGTAQRAGTILATWTEDGLAVDFAETSTADINGSTSAVSFTVTVVSSMVRLNAVVSNGTWTITGSRYFIPNAGKGVGAISNVLPDGKFYIGDATNTAVPQTISGDISITSAGVASINPQVILDGDISSLAAIAVNKLAALTAAKAVITNGSGVLTTSAVTPTELGYLTGVTSNIQTQLDGKVGGITGAISTVVSSDLTASRAVVSDPSGKIAVSGVTSTELGYLTGVTSGIQAQINGKANSSHTHIIADVTSLQASLDAKEATITGAATTVTSSNLTASRAVVSDGSGKLAVSGVTSTELGYLSGVTSSIQTQLDNKMPDELTINDQIGTTYTLALSDKNAHVRSTNVSTNTVTVPHSGTVNFPLGSQVIIVRGGDGQTRIAPASGVVINTIGMQVSNPSYVTISQKYRAATLVKVGADTWDLFGTLQ